MTTEPTEWVMVKRSILERAADRLMLTRREIDDSDRGVKLAGKLRAALSAAPTPPSSPNMGAAKCRTCGVVLSLNCPKCEKDWAS